MPVSDVQCDLVLLSWNHLDETQPCLETLFASTTVPSRLFIVDNGSDPSVRQFLASVKPQGHIREVTLLQNEKNEGFPKGMNRGIQASSAPYVCLLNNDLRFTDGWLEEMIAITRKDPSAGVVNPASSTFGEYPAEGQSPQDYAAHRSSRKGEYTEVGMCIGFCMLIARAVIQKIGGLTEEVNRIFFEDEDYCVRSQRAGFRCVVAEGAYVYHAEHKTIKKMPEREALFSGNQQLIHQKWGRWVRVAWPRFKTIRPGSDELRTWLVRLQSWARNRVHIYAYCPLPKGFTGRQLFESVGLVAHADVRWYPVPAGISGLAALTRILMRQKKRFDIIVAPDKAWAGAAKAFGWLHKAPVVMEADQESLESLWKQKSQSA